MIVVVLRTICLCFPTVLYTIFYCEKNSQQPACVTRFLRESLPIPLCFDLTLQDLYCLHFFNLIAQRDSRLPHRTTSRRRRRSVKRLFKKESA